MSSVVEASPAFSSLLRADWGAWLVGSETARTGKFKRVISPNSAAVTSSLN